MIFYRKFFVVALAFAVALTILSAASVKSSYASPDVSAQQQQPYGALERGWRTGYSDGYQSGWRDQGARRSGDYRNENDYKRADRSYSPSFGSLDDYRDGYRQGFETGYADGYARRVFNSELPAGGVRKRGASAVRTSDDEDDSYRSESASANQRANAPGDDERNARSNSGNDDYSGNYPASSTRGAYSVPADTIMRVELLNRLSTDVSYRGDRFEARVIEPREFEGAIVGGRVADVGRAGKVKGRSQLQLDFDQIRLPNGDWADFSAQVVEVVDMGGEEVGEVDAEGGVRGRSARKDDITKVGASSGVGAIIGAIAGGGKGAAIGAIIGAGVGTAGVVTQRGKDIRFERGQQLLIRTSRETSMK